MKLNIHTILSSLLATAFVLAPWGSVNNARAETIDRVAAVVGDEIITVEDLRLFAKINLVGRGMNVEDLDKTPNREEQMMQLLERMVETRLLVQEAKKLQAPVGDAEVDAQLKRQYQRAGKTEEEFKKILASQGIPWSAYRRYVRDQLRMQFVMRSELGGQVNVSDSDINTCAEERVPEGEEVIEVTLRQVLVSADPLDDRMADRKGVISIYPAWWNAIDAARFSAARSLFNMVVYEEADFKDVATRYSAGRSGENEGLLGTYKQGTLAEEFDPVFELEQGQISDIIETTAGFHIIKVEDKTVVANPDYERAVQTCRGELIQEESNKLIEGWLDTVYDRNFVEMKLDKDISQ